MGSLAEEAGRRNQRDLGGSPRPPRGPRQGHPDERHVHAARERGADDRGHMQGEPVRVTVRFSNGGGDPGIPDYAREGRGMAVKFYLPDGAKTDIVGADAAVLLRAHAEDFLSFTRARKDPERLMPDLLGAHPEALAAIQAALGAEPPASYATCAYNSIHSYRWIDAGGGLALRALPLRARGGRADAVGRGRQGARARLPPGGHPRARRERLPHAGDRRRGRGRS